MTAPMRPGPPTPAEWLDRLEAAHAAAKPFLWRVPTGAREPFDAVPALVAALRKVLDLADALDGSGTCYGPSRQAADRLRAITAALTPEPAP